MPISFLITTLLACTDPNADIKELNPTELNSVIDTLYIEKQPSQNNEEANQLTTASSDEVATETTVDNAERNSAIENQTITPIATSETQEAQIISDDESEFITSIDNGETNQDDILSIDKITAESSDPQQSIIIQYSPDSNSSDTTDTTTENTSSELTSADESDESVEKQVAQNENLSTPVADVSPTSATQVNSPSFSEPTTQSATQAEILLKEVLDKFAVIDYANSPISENEKQTVSTFCEQIANRLSSVSLQGCLEANHRVSPFYTVNGKPIVVTEFAPKEERKPLGKILVIGGTHGDELTSVSTAYKWISNLNKFHSGLFHWHIAPALNADSVLKRPATRQNANGVDINRNLPTPDWEKQSQIRWDKLRGDPRKFPGTAPASEPETQWLMHEIATFKPDAIVSIHAPYGILDFDSPQLSNAPKKFGRLRLNLLGTYPGSLGNYAGIQQQIPVLTLELPNATAMPSQKELAAIWRDMIKWLRDQLNT